MWELPKVSAAAVQLLASNTPMTDAAADTFMGLQTHPACIMPLVKCLPGTCFDVANKPAEAARVKHMLLSVLGDLEEVWASPVLQEVLLELPLHVIKLLLSYDQLKVASEDTVLFTAQSYLDKHYKRSIGGAGNNEARDQYVQQLGSLVRCQHLSQFWLTAASTAKNAAQMVLGSLKTSLRALLTARQAEPGKDLTGSIPKEIPGAPDSWGAAAPRHQTACKRCAVAVDGWCRSSEGGCT